PRGAALRIASGRRWGRGLLGRARSRGLLHTEGPELAGDHRLLKTVGVPSASQPGTRTGPWHASRSAPKHMEDRRGSSRATSGGPDSSSLRRDAGVSTLSATIW